MCDWNYCKWCLKAIMPDVIRKSENEAKRIIHQHLDYRGVIIKVTPIHTADEGGLVVVSSNPKPCEHVPRVRIGRKKTVDVVKIFVGKGPIPIEGSPGDPPTGPVIMQVKSAKDWFDEGENWVVQRKYADAQLSFGKAVELEPGNADYRYWLGFSLLRQDDKLDDAERELKEAISIAASKGEYHRELGEVQYKKKEYAQSEQTLREAVRLLPEDAACRKMLGNALFDQGTPEKLKEAVSEYKEAIRLDPRNSILHANLAATWLKLNQCEDAKKEADEAKRLDPSIEHGVFKELLNCPVEIPALRGKSYDDEVKGLLTKLGLRVNKKMDYDAEIPPGFVMSPDTDSTAQPGSIVDVVVSVAPAELRVQIDGKHAKNGNLSFAVWKDDTPVKVEPELTGFFPPEWKLKLLPGRFVIGVSCAIEKRSASFDPVVDVTVNGTYRCSLLIKAILKNDEKQIGRDEHGQYLKCTHLPGKD